MSICVGKPLEECPDIEPKGFCIWREASGNTKAHCRQNSNMAPLLLETIEKINTLMVNFKEGKGDKEDYNELIKKHENAMLLLDSVASAQNKEKTKEIEKLKTDIETLEQTLALKGNQTDVQEMKALRDEMIIVKAELNDLQNDS